MWVARILVMSLALWVGGMAAADVPSLTPSSEADRLVLRDLDGRVLHATLRLKGAERGVALEIRPGDEGTTDLVSPWPLMPGEEYVVAVETAAGAHLFELAAVPSASPEPTVLSVAPGSGVVPENLLRFHVYFGTAMARGEARDHIRLERSDGTAVADAFLELGVELWSEDQRRLTLLFDPGRIKQGVGPNLVLGAPLVAGETYALVIAPGLMDASGRRIAEVYRHEFLAGPPVRTAQTPEAWRASVDAGRLSVDFGRVMDAASVARYLAVEAGDGSYALADPTSPELVWDVSGYPDDMPLRLVASPLLEDAAGNTICAAFDVAAGDATRCEDGQPIEILVR